MRRALVTATRLWIPMEFGAWRYQTIPVAGGARRTPRREPEDQSLSMGPGEVWTARELGRLLCWWERVKAGVAPQGGPPRRSSRPRAPARTPPTCFVDCAHALRCEAEAEDETEAGRKRGAPGTVGGANTRSQAAGGKAGKASTPRRSMEFGFAQTNLDSPKTGRDGQHCVLLPTCLPSWQGPRP